jgi:hypothetical protein
MATIRKDALVFSNGKEINLPNGILAITRRLELADYYSRYIFFLDTGKATDRKVAPVANVYALTQDELIEACDAMIQLWIDLKDNIRSLGIENPEIFRIRKEKQ